MVLPGYPFWLCFLGLEARSFAKCDDAVLRHQALFFVASVDLQFNYSSPSRNAYFNNMFAVICFELLN